MTYPETYPDVAPYLDLSHPPNSSKKPANLDLSTDKTQLLEALEPTIEESLGMAMVFSLVTAVKESAEQLIADRRTAAEQEREAVLRAEEEKEDAKFHGEKVTKESFLRWREQFLQEKKEEEKKRAEDADVAARKGGKVSAPSAKEEKLTGRQLWEKGLVGKGWEEDEGDGIPPALGKGVDALKVDG